MVCWFVVLRIYIALAIFQPHCYSEKGANLWNRSGVAGNRTQAACSARQELNHYTTTAPRRPDKWFFWNIFLQRCWISKFGKKFRVWPEELLKRFPKVVIYVSLCQWFWSDLKTLTMKIKHVSTTSSKSNKLRNINTVWWESMVITTQPGKLAIGNPKSLLVNVDVDIST